MAALLSDPIGSGLALGSAIYNLDDTVAALKQGIEQTWQDYLDGDLVTRSKIVGKLSFEVLTALVPVSKLGALEKIMKASKGVRSFGGNMLDPIFSGKIFPETLTQSQALSLVDDFGVFVGKGPGKEALSIPGAVEMAKDYYVRGVQKYKALAWHGSDDINKIFHGQYPDSLPYKPNTRVFSIQSTGYDDFVRVHGPNNQKGVWMVKRQTVEGLTPTEIQAKLNLKHKPTHLSHVRVSPGTEMFKGTFNNFLGGKHFTSQYELKKAPPDSFFKTPPVKLDNKPFDFPEQ